MNDSARRKKLGVERVPHLGISHPGRRRWRAYAITRSALLTERERQRRSQFDHSRVTGGR